MLFKSLPAVLKYDNAEFGPGHLCEDNKCSILTLPLKQLKAIVFMRIHAVFPSADKVRHCCLPYPLLFQRPWLKEGATGALCGGKKNKKKSFEIRVKRRKEEKKRGDALTCCTQRAGEVLQKERRGEVRGEGWDKGKGSSFFFFFFFLQSWMERERKKKAEDGWTQHTKGHDLHCNCCARRRLGFSSPI